MSTARPNLRERKNERTRAAIARAALELASEIGFDRTTVAQIAERADVSPRTVHAWYPAKEDIVLGGADVRIDRLEEELRAGEGDTLARLRRWLVAEGAQDAERDDLQPLRQRVIFGDAHLRAAHRARQERVELLVAQTIADEVGVAADAVGPRALAAAVVTTLLGLQARHADPDSARRGQESEVAFRMLDAALGALRGFP